MLSNVDKLDAILFSMGHAQFRSWRSLMINWANRRGATVIWGMVGQRPTRVYQVGKTVIVVQTLHQMGRRA